jgi:hypothetical protein
MSFLSLAMIDKVMKKFYFIIDIVMIMGKVNNFVIIDFVNNQYYIFVYYLIYNNLNYFFLIFVYFNIVFNFINLLSDYLKYFLNFSFSILFVS